jgi:hypothetical protein
MGDCTVARQGSLGQALIPCTRRPALACAVLCGLALAGPLRVLGRQPSPATSTTTAPNAEKLPIERQPYKILVNLVCDPSARIDGARRASLVREWQVLVHRFIGSPWVVSLAPDSSPLSNLDVDTLKPDAFANVGPFDKVWLIRIAHAEAGSGLVFKGREYDSTTRGLGTLQRRSVPSLANVARELLQFAQGLFNPTALITGQGGGRALLTVRGASIAPATPVGAVVATGAVFLPLRLILIKDGKTLINRIPFTYLRVETVDGPIARCAIVSPLYDPLTLRMSRPFTMVGVGVKPGNSPVKIRFLTKPDRTPAAGYMLTARLVPDGQPHELGLTDRSGRIVLKPGFADGLVTLRLLAGNVEPMVEFPIMPGESAEELSIPFEPKPLTVALEAQLDSLRDEVVDLVALRARLETRMKARLEGEDWDGLKATIEEFSKLTPHDSFAERLTKLKDDAAHKQAETKKAVLTRTAGAQISDLQAMIDRYLDDDVYKAYIEALDRSKTDADAKAKALAKAEAKKAANKAQAPTATAKNAAAATVGQPKNALMAPASAPKDKPKRPEPPRSDMPF